MRFPAPLALLLLSLVCVQRSAAQEPDPPVAVAARDLPRGAVLRPADVSRPAGAAADSSVAPVGWVTRRMIEAGEPLREPAVAAPAWVRNGDPVQLLWSSGAVQLRVVGRAMGTGARGERVWVRLDARRRFAGVVVEPGVVRMETPERTRS